ncbi:MAG: hypothetical protein MJZ76_03955 [Bacteroidales bacterium]|nr:hypothetical protein [Bacteroidales bacterium]
MICENIETRLADEGGPVFSLSSVSVRMLSFSLDWLDIICEILFEKMDSDY